MMEASNFHPSFKISEYDQYFPGIGNTIRSHINTSTDDAINVEVVIDAVVMESHAVGLRNLFNTCENLDWNRVVKAVAKYSFQKLFKLLDDDDEKSDLNTKYIQMLSNAEKTNMAFQSNKRKRKAEEPGEEEHPSKHPKFDDSQQTGSTSLSPVSSSSILAKLKSSSTLTTASTTNAPNISTSSTSKAQVILTVPEKDAMMIRLKTLLPEKEPRVLFLTLKHYRFDIKKLEEDLAQGKINFRDLEKRYLLEELTMVKNRLIEIDKEEKSLAATPTAEIAEKTVEVISEDQDPATTIPMPKHWENTSYFKVIPIDLLSEEGLSVRERFYKNDPSSLQVFDLKEIRRIQNKRKFEQYKLKQYEIVQLSGKSNELLLFHGCPADKIDVIAQQGFDMRVANFKGAAGVGLYFAQLPRTSLSYIRDCEASSMKLLLCRVELGVQTSLKDLHKAFPNASIANPIRRPQARSKTDKTPFDSVYGNMRDDPNHPIHVIYDNYQVYPEYILTFSISEDRIVRGPRPSQSQPVGCDHPRYRAQLDEIRKSLKFLKRSIAYEVNRQRPDYAFLVELLELLETDPSDPNSPHQTKNMTLDSLQEWVRYYNQLGSNCQVLVLPPIKLGELMKENESSRK